MVNKKFRLRKWVKWVLGLITLFVFIILASDVEITKTFILKTIIGFPIFCINMMVLIVYGGLNEE